MACKKQQWQINKKKTRVDSIGKKPADYEQEAADRILPPLAPRTQLVCPTDPTENVGWELTPSEKRFNETCAYVPAITVCRRKLGTKKITKVEPSAFSSGFSQGFA